MSSPVDLGTPLDTAPQLIAGHWQPAPPHAAAFASFNPATGEALPTRYPVADSATLDAMLAAGAGAALILRDTAPARLAAFLEAYATALEARTDALVAMAHRETGLPVEPRLRNVELPRTTNQLRQAAAAARDGSWSLPTLDTRLNLRSRFEPLGKPVVVFGPNNFPFAFNGIAGGDFAAAIAAGHPVIAKAHSSHPGTCRLLAEAAVAALDGTGLPAATVQMLYRCAPDDGLRLVGDPRVGAVAFTGGRATGLRLKAAADAAGVPVYLELGSINPVFFLPGALAERAAALADEFAGSCLLGCGQFCTNPGLVLLVRGGATEAFLAAVTAKFRAALPGPLLAGDMPAQLTAIAARLAGHGAQLLCGGGPTPGAGFRYPPTLLRADGAAFLSQPAAFQEEMFGPAALCVVADDADQLLAVATHLEANLTGCVYSALSGADDALYVRVVSLLAPRVGRLLNDKMPTGVAVSPAMMHGGPYPASGHPGFTAVGIPASLRRFAALRCYDNVRSPRLPAALQDHNPTGRLWRCVDGAWTQADIPPAPRA